MVELQILKLTAQEAIAEIQRRNHYTLKELRKILPAIFEQRRRERLEEAHWESLIHARSLVAEIKGPACRLPDRP